jgi:anti-sigma regulatory factor (Ser/Thr protein kinase)
VTAAYPVPPYELGSMRFMRIFPGEPRQVRRVRAFAADALAGCPARESLLACVSELAANAIAHTASGAGGVFTVEVTRLTPGMALVAVTDAGGPREPAIRRAAESGDQCHLAECGRGLALVDALASRWGYRALDIGAGRTVWAEATWPVAVAMMPLPRTPSARRMGVSAVPHDRTTRLEFRALRLRSRGCRGFYPREPV